MRTYLVTYLGSWGSACFDVANGSHPFEAACTFFRNHPMRRLCDMRDLGRAS